MGYLVHKYKCSAKEAYQHLVSISPKSEIPFEYMQQLWAFELDWTGCSTIEGSALSCSRILPSLGWKGVDFKGYLDPLPINKASITPSLVNIILTQRAGEISKLVRDRLQTRNIQGWSLLCTSLT